MVYNGVQQFGQFHRSTRGQIMCARAILFGIALSAWCAAAQATPIIVVGNYFILPTAGNVVHVFVSGGDPVSELNLNAQIGDGGPDVGGTDLTPTLTADVVSGTIFAGNNTGQLDLDNSGNQFASVFISAASGTVNADGLLVTLTIDATGYGGHTFPLSLMATAFGPTNFGQTSAEIFDGQITVSPEPRGLILGLLSATALGFVAVRKRRAKRPSIA